MEPIYRKSTPFIILVTVFLALGGRPSAGTDSPPLPPPPGADAVGEHEIIDAPAANPEESYVTAIPWDKPSLPSKIAEVVPKALCWPDQLLGHWFGRILGAEHVEVKTVLDEYATGMQGIPARPPLIVEWNERFLAPGMLSPGLQLPTGAVWRPSFWVFGQHRGAYQYFDSNRSIDPVSEWASRLDLFGQVNLTGTERLLIGLRPLDEERGNRREFVSYDFRDGRSIDGWNGDVQTLFFEGDFGELFPHLDPFDTRSLDWGFSFGRMPLLAQQGLLINEDMIDATTVTRNTLYGHGVLNLRVTGAYAWKGINRNSPTARPNDYDPSSRLVAILTETDIYRSTINLDAVYADSQDSNTGDLVAFGISAIQRFYGYHHTYNTSLHVLGSFPTKGTTPYAQQGELLFSQISWTPHHTVDLVYLNGFWAIDQFTSPARGPLQGSPLGQTGLLFSASGLGRFDAPINVRTNDTMGGSLGYQIFFDETRRQVIWELGGYTHTKDSEDQNAVGTGLRCQTALGQHLVVVVDGFLVKREGFRTTPSVRTEFLVKF